MTRIVHDPYRASVTGSPARIAPVASGPGPEWTHSPESVAVDLAAWVDGDVGRFHHVLLTVDALATV